MADRPSMTTAARRRWALMAAVIGWIVIVVVGAGADADDSLIGVENLDSVLIIIMVVLALLGLALIIWLNPFSGEWTPPEKQRRGGALWFLLALVAVLWIWRPDFLEDLADDDTLDQLSSQSDGTEVPPSETELETVAQATDLLLIALGLALLGGLWYFLWRRYRQNAADSLSPDAQLEADLVQALEEASRELAITGDPRTAVLRSYAVLETVLGTHGLTRAESETPTEHMRRALQNLRVKSEPLIELGALYELARFSERTITEAQQRDATQALTRARTSLAAQT